MYTPAAFVETDLSVLHDFIEQHSFAALVSETGGALLASHLPFLLDRQTGPRGTLTGHMARANPQWKNIHEQSVLVIFSGPHAYISPTWYTARNVVPTWDYVAVHVSGRGRLIDDREESLAILRRTVDTYERTQPAPWSLTDAEPDFIKRLAEHIVCFRIEIDRIEGQWKLSQNHTAERRERIVRELETSADSSARDIAERIRRTLPV